MKTKLIVIIIVLAMLPIYRVTFAQTDSTEIDLGDGWNLRFDLIPFGAIVQASADEKTQLEAKQFIGSGIGMSFVFKNTYGINASVLFYSGQEKKVYPLVAIGGILFLKNKVAISPAWDFGKIDGNFNNGWIERVKLLVSYNFNLLQ